MSLIVPVKSLLHSVFSLSSLETQNHKYTYIFYKQLVYKELALGWQIAKQPSRLNPLSLSNNKN